MLKLEIANTPSSLERGLMYRESLPTDGGMIFVFGSTRVLNFWGMNTYVPLDIAFIGSDMRIKKISHINKFSRKTVNSESPCSMAIETNRGYFDENGISNGHKIIVKELDKNNNIVKVAFEKE